MGERAETDTMFSTRRWFLSDGGDVRPLWRSAIFILLSVGLYILIVPSLYSVTRGWPKELGWPLRSAALIVAFLLMSWLLLTVFDRRSFRTLGLWFYRGWGREFGVGLAAGAALMGSVVLSLVVAQAVTYHTFAPRELTGVLTWGGILLLAAAFEEITFRGYGMQRLIEALGEPGGVLVFSGLFAALHISNPGSTTISSVNTFLAGILLSLAYLKTRGLWLPIALHWSWNFLQGQIFSLPTSGFHFAPRLFKTEVSGPQWISGGSYGPEGSIVLTVVCILAILWLGQTKSISPSPAMEEGLE
jgi:membrane protease YdiL (CAAX protease family)